ncbi:hypothetical protein HII36_29650 [Nonomuraea sp. NN258]|uniref:hypothetical protein n=1 Tax=Nonomuraea antri TaxID=2730852 RepID=UPI0015699A53|nr:hypothetical protein [Nonomuraea antri]NRQ35966.1 hypothetical protein [Nonomuraea antri]
MDTTTAATQASVTVATIRTWCRRGAVAAAKVAGRWVIEAASLARRIALGTRKVKPVLPDLTQEFCDVVTDSAYAAADAGSTAGLKKLLADVKARNVTAVMGPIDPAQVSLDDSAWYQLERLVSFQLGCVRAERDDYM